MTKPFHFYIVTPSYNQADFLEQTLKSVQLQECQVTHIVMDGGSKDDSVKILKKYDKKIVWQSKKDRGQSHALNLGLEKVLSRVPVADLENSIFAYINSDDYYLPHAFERVAQTFLDTRVQWVVGECQIVDHQGQTLHSAIKTYKSMWRKVLAQNLLYVLNPIPQPAVFIRLSAVKKVGSFNESLRYTMDYEYWLRVWAQVGKPKVLRDELAAFRIHQTSKGTQDFSSQFAEQLQVAKRFTSNPAWLLLQNVHNRLITASYSLIK